MQMKNLWEAVQPDLKTGQLHCSNQHFLFVKFSVLNTNTRFLPADTAHAAAALPAVHVLQSAPAEANRVQKKKLWEAVQPDLKTGEDCTAAYKGAVMHTSAGPVTAKTLAKANIS